MAITSSKLAKLTILVFQDRARSQLVDMLMVMFNPASFSVAFKSDLAEGDAINTEAYKLTYFRSPPTSISLKLILDGTGVSEGPPGSLSRRVEAFLKSTVYMNGSSHEPNYLRVQWGDSLLQNFDCRATGVTVTYTSFDRSGAPIRAELDVELKEDLDDQKRVGREGKSSPDLSHCRMVRAGDTLPMLCREIYGSQRYYMQVARANGLSNFRDLTPGTEIVFPPLSR